MRPRLKDKRLYWRGNTIWCRVLGATGTIDRRTTKCCDEAAASAKADEFERVAANPTYAAAAAATLAGALTAYFADLDRRGRSAATKKKARQKVGHYVRIWGADLPMIRISAKLVLDYIDQRQREGAKAITIKDELGHLGQTLKLARHLGTFHETLDRVMPPFFSGQHKPKDRWPTPAEIEALEPHLTPARMAHIMFILATGARLGESFRAQRSDVYLATGLVHIRGTKTEKSDDDVPITVISKPVLEWALANAPGKTRLFNPWGKLHRDLEAACVRAGIKKLTPNDIRRGFGKWHRMAGIDVTTVSKMLRHTTDKLAQTTYAKVSGAEVGELAAPQVRNVPRLAFTPVPELPAAPPQDPPAAPSEVASGEVGPDEFEAPPAVPILYAQAAQTAPTDGNGHSKSLAEQAPPTRFERVTNALGKRSINARSAGTKKAWERRKASCAVPILYAKLGADLSGNSVCRTAAVALGEFVAGEWAPTGSHHG